VRYHSDLSSAMLAVERALKTAHRNTMWRWLVLNRLAALRTALVSYEDAPHDPWLAPRTESLLRERQRLVDDIAGLEESLDAGHDDELIQGRISRLLGDISHHRQRAADIVYDTVALELGGGD
jgi:hypothetical protein